jgi:hypothetical protein
MVLRLSLVSKQRRLHLKRLEDYILRWGRLQGEAKGGHPEWASAEKHDASPMAECGKISGGSLNSIGM